MLQPTHGQLDQLLTDESMSRWRRGGRLQRVHLRRGWSRLRRWSDDAISGQARLRREVM